MNKVLQQFMIDPSMSSAELHRDYFEGEKLHLLLFLLYIIYMQSNHDEFIYFLLNNILNNADGELLNSVSARELELFLWTSWIGNFILI